MFSTQDDFLSIIVTSPSGAGKTTLVRRLLQRNPDLVQSVSTTTRAPRSGEEDGRDYHFVSRERFDEAVTRGGFAEWAEVHGQRYGTSLERIAAARGRYQGMVFVIDQQGARQFKAKVPDAVGVFVLPPSFAALEMRLRRRGTDSEESVARRLRDARVELTHYGLFDYVVLNDDVDRASDELHAIVTAERARRSRRASLVEAVIRGGEAARWSAPES